MMLNAVIAVCGLLGLLFLLLAVRRIRRRRFGSSVLHTFAARVFFFAAAAVGLLGAGLSTYQRLTHEQLAAELMLTKLGDRHFRATLTYPSNATQAVELRGDEWQIDARLLKWHGFANVAGFDTVYRLERIGGRYSDIADEKTAARTVYALNPPARVDAWELLRQYKEYVPWADALLGSATFLPMADGALYQVNVSQSGLIARPVNQAARGAVTGWR